MDIADKFSSNNLLSSTKFVHQVFKSISSIPQPKTSCSFYCYFKLATMINYSLKSDFQKKIMIF